MRKAPFENRLKVERKWCQSVLSPNPVVLRLHGHLERICTKRCPSVLTQIDSWNGFARNGANLFWGQIWLFWSQIGRWNGSARNGANPFWTQNGSWNGFARNGANLFWAQNRLFWSRPAHRVVGSGNALVQRPWLQETCRF